MECQDGKPRYSEGNGATVPQAHRAPSTESVSELIAVSCTFSKSVSWSDSGSLSGLGLVLVVGHYYYPIIMPVGVVRTWSGLGRGAIIIN